MAKRKIIHIDKKKCNGCGLCIPNCPEGAIQIIDGKARLISDIFCDGLGACIGHCPEGAISFEEREAEPYDEKKVMENVIKEGKNTILAHLNHLKDHGEITYLNQALEVLKEKKISLEFDTSTDQTPCQHAQCPGSNHVELTEKSTDIAKKDVSSQLRQWPVQMHLISPDASSFKESDLLLVADCVGFALGGLHQRFLKGKSVAIACPKLDSNLDVYLQKLITLIDRAHINTLTVMTMQVPCCNGLLILAQKALEGANRNIPIKHIIISIKGEIIKDEWI